MRRINCSISFIAAIFGALSLSSCRLEQENSYIVVNEGDEVQFGAYRESLTTKTIYEDEIEGVTEGNAWQLHWVDGDKVHVYCQQASRQYGSYRVEAYSNPADDTQKPNYKVLKRLGDAGIQWGAPGQHDFYSVYPDDPNHLISYDMKNHVVEFKVPSEQIVKVSKKSGSEYQTSSEMTNAYMVAKKQVNFDDNKIYENGSSSPSDAVHLTFDPIMTTLKLTIQGPHAADQNFGAESVVVTDVLVVLENVPETSNGTFFYSIDDKQIVSNSATSNTSTSIRVHVLDQNGKDGVTLAKDESMIVQMFLPPVAIGGDTDTHVRITVATEEVGWKTVTLPSNSTGVTIKPSSKRLVKLPYLSENAASGKNWITPLDDNIYVCQLSIPGTHDAGTGDGKYSDSIVHGLVGFFAKWMGALTQDRKISEQLSDGVRAFDLRPSMGNRLLGGSDELEIYHGVVRMKISWEGVMNEFKTFLENNPGEFVIMVVRHEEEAENTHGSSSVNAARRALWHTKMAASLSDLRNAVNPSTGETYLADWAPDMTIADARGKIILLSRQDINGALPIAGAQVGWGHSRDGVVTTMSASNGKSGVLKLQDYYSANADGVGTDNDFVSTKWSSVQALFNVSKEAYKPDSEDKFTWFINHTSGYTGTSNYPENGAYQNPRLVELISSAGFAGSTGIVMMDFAGVNTSSSTGTSYDVAGLDIVQAMINCNYKYHMLRKGE